MNRSSSPTGVVVIGRNEGERLERCLRSLDLDVYPTVYVDSASTDGSPDLAERMGAVVVPLDLALPFTAARARAAGFAKLEERHPNLRYVFFVDGDCEVEQGFILKAERFLEDNPDAAVVCGRRRERFPELSRYNALADHEWDTPVGQATACGGDAVYRCEAYRAAGGFDEAMLAGEEPELCARLRSRDWTIHRIGEPMTVHDAAMTRFSQWWRRAIRSGMGYAQAWLATKATPGARLYGRELSRAILWALILPLVSIALAIAAHPALLAIWPGMTALQLVRLALRDGIFPASLSVAGKYAELLGVVRFAWRTMMGRSGSTVHYK